MISEVEIDKQLTGRRAAKPGFIECSFPTIAGADIASIVPIAAKCTWFLATHGIRDSGSVSPTDCGAVHAGDACAEAILYPM